MVKLTKLSRPFVVAVAVERTAAAAARAVAASFRDGADAVELNLSSLPETEQPTSAFFRKHRGPIYTSCRRAAFMGVYGDRLARLPAWSDETRMDLQLAALGHGAAGLDIEADTFAPSPDEWTRDRRAIRRQRAVAAAARRRGAAVIFSWHPPRALTFAEALRAARALEARGADFIKIVERVRNEREALDAVAISLRLREKLATPFIFLPLGPGAARFRPFMSAFGAAYLLARPPVGANRLPAQPLVAKARALVDLA
jgi:3-dehydroquinate dehydratase